MMEKEEISAQMQAIILIQELRSGSSSDERQREIILELDKILPDPNYFDYLVDFVPEMSAEQVVAKAFRYKSIQI
jgi:hypothetical protein